ncbi:MAG: SDR family NAD(P)-dependent oxidoreductase [Hyphomicrobiales bacterium]|nr:SDR family NAD(P)-dependent oxidoreductase [Hyphomicrobiales bacterium]
MKTFQNKVAVITGAGSGMGRYLALNLAQEGCNVAICDINTSSLKETEELIKNYNISCSTHNLDLRDKNNIDILVKETLLNHGKVDLLFNNAGVVSPSAFLEMKESDWDWCNDINFNSLVYCSRAFLPHLMKDEESALVNTSSIFGIITTPNNTVYHASKFAVRGFTESLAMELKDDPIQVNCVYPGHIGTNIVLDARFGKDILLTNGEYAKDNKGNALTVKDVGSTFKESGMNPDKAAKIILKGVKKNKKRIFVGLDAKIMEIAQRLSPSHYIAIIPILNLLIFPYFIKRIKMLRTFYSLLKAKQ